jgi:hypothetical protein
MHCSPKAMGERVGTAKSDDGQINLKLDRPVAPLEDFFVADGKLRFTDLGQKHGVLSASIYSYSWFSFDNQRAADLKAGSGGQTYRQGRNRPLRVPKGGRHQGPRIIY